MIESAAFCMFPFAIAVVSTTDESVLLAFGAVLPPQLVSVNATIAVLIKNTFFIIDKCLVNILFGLSINITYLPALYYFCLDDLTFTEESGAGLSSILLVGYKYSVSINLLIL